MHRLRRLALGEHGPVFRWVFAAVAFGGAFVLRYLLEGALPEGFPYLTFFPAVILTGFVAGVWAGTVVAVACGLASWYFFIGPLNSFALNGASLLALALYVFIVSTDLVLIHLMREALRALQVESERADRLANQNGLMFHELQHRVSNNLQVISSLLKMQRRDVADAQACAALDAASARLQIVSNIQRLLHSPKRQTTDLGALLHDVLPEVMATNDPQARVQLEFSTAPLVLDRDQINPAALIVVELVSNALEHAQGAEQAVRVRVSTATEGKTGVVVVHDNGRGLPKDFAPENLRSLGLRIAQLFTEQLGGSLAFGREGGTRVELRFPLPEGA